MAIKKTAIIVLICITGFSAACQNFQFHPSFAVAFDSTYGNLLIKQCSRSNPKDVSGFWTLQHEDVLNLEENFRKVNKISSSVCCEIKTKVGWLEHYEFQYLGLIIGGAKFIYINAFPISARKYFEKNGKDASTTAIVICGGGIYNWGALFNIKTKEFSELAFNASK